MIEIPNAQHDLENEEGETILVDILTNYAKTASRNASKCNLHTFRSIMRNLIQKKIHLHEAHAKCLELFGTILPIEEYSLIMKNEEVPKMNLIKKQTNNTSVKGTSHRKKTMSWTPEEDRRLIYAIYKYGTKNWTKVSNFLGSNRNRSTCSQRWNRILSPKIEKGKWTREEEINLLKLCIIFGTSKWSAISHMLKTRSDTQCRYHFEHLKKTGELNQIMKEIEENGIVLNQQILNDAFLYGITQDDINFKNKWISNEIDTTLTQEEVKKNWKKLIIDVTINTQDGVLKNNKTNAIPKETKNKMASKPCQQNFLKKTEDELLINWDDCSLNWSDDLIW